MSSRFLIFIAIVAIFAAQALSLSYIEPEGLRLEDLVSEPTQIIFLTIGMLASVPLAFVMPRLKASLFGRWWRVPSNTYLMPRWCVWLVIGGTLGQVIGLLVLALLRDLRLIWLAALAATVCTAFAVGAWSRLKKPPAMEFSMPFWGGWRLF